MRLIQAYIFYKDGEQEKHYFTAQKDAKQWLLENAKGRSHVKDYGVRMHNIKNTLRGFVDYLNVWTK